MPNTMGKKVAFLTGLILTGSLIGHGAFATKSPFDVSGLNQKEILQHFARLKGQPVQVTGVVKDADDLKATFHSMIYEIPVYKRDESHFVKYGIVCQRQGDSTIFFADEGYLSLFVKKNTVDRPVLAKGRLMEGRQTNGLPNGVVFVVESMRLEEFDSNEIQTQSETEK
jgi:hypothetical protein